jgi:hypothetical protein
MGFEAFMVMMSQVKVFWVVMVCSVVLGYHCFRGSCCLHLHGEVARMGKNSIDTGLDRRGVVGAKSQWDPQRE